MAASLARLTLYALISAVEVDIRAILSTHMPNFDNLSKLFGDDLLKRLIDRLEKDIDYVDESPTLSDLLTYSDLGDLQSLLNTYKGNMPKGLFDEIGPNKQAFSSLISVRNRVMHNRPLSYDDLPKVVNYCENLISKSAWVSLNDAKDTIKAKPEFLLNIEIPALEEASKCAHNLPLPDFDETGFIGRDGTLANLKKACLGVFPVVTVVGEGGLGKTALVLKLAYDLLDDPNSPFEAIIFVSAKTTQLTATEIRRIDGAITSSLGLIEKAVLALEGNAETPQEELLRLLGESKILLIIDNLETVVDNNIRVFLENFPAGSKLIVTSRIGLGAFEFPIKLSGLSEAEAIQLLRATASVRNCPKLVQMENKKLSVFCTKMRNNPLHIKWFVSAVQAGARPEDSLANEKLFLQFCLSNVYDHLTDIARRVVRALLAVGGALTIAEIAFITTIDDLNLLKAIQELMRTNILSMSSAVVGKSFESRYELSQLARSYVGKFYPVNKEEQQRLLKVKQQLVIVAQQIGESKLNEASSANNIFLRNRSDWVIAIYLKKALEFSRQHNFEAAHVELDRARTLAPDYFEVHRITGFILSASGNFIEAADSFQSAIDLEPDSFITRQLYGGLLMRDLADLPSATLQLREALRINPNSCDVIIELARCLMFGKQFIEAGQLLWCDQASKSDHEKHVKKIEDLRIQYHSRFCDFHIKNNEPGKAMDSLLKIRNAYEDSRWKDPRMKQSLIHSLSYARNLQVQLKYQNDSVDKLGNLIDWILEQTKDQEITPMFSSDGLSASAGKIIRISPNKTFGFIVIDAGGEIFFHHSEFKERKQDLEVGLKISFEVSSDKDGRPVAIKVTTKL